MTLIHHDSLLTWSGPETVALRGTLILLPGRGESPTVYERFGRRLAADAYRVHAVASPQDDPAGAQDAISTLLCESDAGSPRVLVGSDSGALFAAQLLAQSGVAGVSALILAGLPTSNSESPAQEWDAELEARTSCSTHRARISSAGVHRGGLYRPIPTDWFVKAAPDRLSVPVLGLHGSADPISPLHTVRSWYARIPQAELVSVAGGRHDALNDQTHRSVAATIVLFLERLRQGAAPGGALAPIVTAEPLSAEGVG